MLFLLEKITGSASIASALNQVNVLKNAALLDVVQPATPATTNIQTQDAINPQLTRAETITRSIEKSEQSLNIRVAADPGTSATIETDTSSSIPRVSSTLADPF